MYGYIEERKRGGIERRQIGGMWFLAATLPAEGLGYRVRRRRIWRALQKMGVRRAVMEPEIMAEASCWGIFPVEVVSLRRALLPQLMDLLPPLQGKTASLIAPCLTTDVEAAACFLARRCRYLRLEIAQGREELARRLYTRFGLTAGSVGQTAVTICFGGVAQGRSLCLGEDCAALQEITYAVEKLEKEGVKPQEMLLAALFDGGYLPKEAILVKSIGAKP